ncbi:MAG: hypothetical protein JW841_13455 [Deltaproteobacteria bacterium]|nr:hypothetical protein [Deltaproteobacteria bacterium]
MNQKLLSICIISTLTFTACKKDDVKVDDVNTRSSAIVKNTITTTTSALNALQNEQTIKSLEQAFEQLNEIFGGSTSNIQSPLSSSLKTLQAKATLASKRLKNIKSSSSALDEVSSVDTEEDIAADINDFLQQYIFTDDNLESSDENSATLLIKGTSICETEDSECISSFTEAQIRIKATLTDNDGVNFDLMIGSSRTNPISIEATPKSIAVQLDLAAFKNAYQQIAAITGDDVSDMPEVLQGILRAKLVINGEQDISLTGSIIKALQLKTNETEGATGLSLAAADPLIAMDLQGLTSTMEIALNAGSGSFYAPYSSLDEESTITDSFSINFAGASFNVSLQPETDLVITNVSIGKGPLTLTLGAKTLLSLLLNPSSDYTFDVAIKATEANDAVLTFTPELNVILDYDFVNTPFEDPYAEVAMAETYEIDISGNGSATIQSVPEDATGFDGGIKVVSGTLNLSAASDQSSVQVSQGQCLVSVDSEPEAGAPLTAYVQAASCF